MERAYKLRLDDADDLDHLRTWLTDGHCPSLLLDRIARQVLAQAGEVNSERPWARIAELEASLDDALDELARHGIRECK